MDVNYINERESFVRHARDNGYTGNEQLLWYALFTIFNERAGRNGGVWPDGFIRITNKELLSWLPFTENTLHKVRADMINQQKHDPVLFDYLKGKKNTDAPQYKMHYFPDKSYRNSRGNIGGNMQGNNGGNMGGNMQGNNGGNNGGNIGAINNKLNINDTEPNGESEKLYYNNAWRTDARAAYAVAQRILDRLPELKPDGYPGANTDIANWLLEGMTPEQALYGLCACKEMCYVPEHLRSTAIALGLIPEDEDED